MSESASRRRAVTRSDLPFLASALISGFALLYLGRSLTFWWDEWDFAAFSGSAVDFLRPYHEHWYTLPLLLYRGTFHVVQLHSYLPYLAEVIVLHVGAVAGAYCLLRTRLGPFLATVLCLPLLLLGAGSENLFWAFQTGFVGSVLLGVWALVFLERPGRWGGWIASLLLLASLMSSGMGLFFVVAAVVRTVLDPVLRPRAMAVVPPVLAYAAWYFTVGDDAVDRAGLTDVPLVLDFASRGVGHAAEAMLALEGLPTRQVLGLTLVGALFVVAVWGAVRGRQRSLALACLVALVSTYVVIGLVRDSLDLEHWDRSRYLYVAAFFLVLAFGDLLPRQSSTAEPGLGQKAIVAAVVVVAGWALAANIDALEQSRALQQHRADVTRAFVALAMRPGGDWVDPAARLENTPPVRELRGIVQQHGSPLEDRIVPSVATAPSPIAREQAILAIVGERFHIEPSAGSGSPVPIDVSDARGVSVTGRSRCIDVRTLGDDGWLVLAVPSGARVRVDATQPLSGAVGLGHRFGPSRWLDLRLDGRAPADVVVPHGPGKWKVGFSFESASGVRLCAVGGRRRS